MSVAGLCGLELALLEKPPLRAAERGCQLSHRLLGEKFPQASESLGSLTWSYPFTCQRLASHCSLQMTRTATTATSV